MQEITFKKGTQQPGCYFIEKNGDDLNTINDRSLITVILCNKNINFEVDSKQMKYFLKSLSTNDIQHDMTSLVDSSINITIHSGENATFYLRNNSVPVEISLAHHINVHAKREKRQIPIPVPNLFALCSHSRSTVYFIESMRSTSPFTSVQCSSWGKFKSQSCTSCGRNRMGFFSQKTSSPSVYYLDVNSNAPFSPGEPPEQSSLDPPVFDFCSSNSAHFIRVDFLFYAKNFCFLFITFLFFFNL